MPTEVRLEFLGFHKDSQQELVVGFDSEVFVYFHNLHPHLFELAVPIHNRDFTGSIVFEWTTSQPQFPPRARPTVLGADVGQCLGTLETVGTCPREHTVIPEHPQQLIHHVTYSI